MRAVLRPAPAKKLYAWLEPYLRAGVYPGQNSFTSLLRRLIHRDKGSPSGTECCLSRVGQGNGAWLGPAAQGALG
jgi:hypothetical protein